MSNHRKLKIKCYKNIFMSFDIRTSLVQSFSFIPLYHQMAKENNTNENENSANKAVTRVSIKRVYKWKTLWCSSHTLFPPYEKWRHGAAFNRNKSHVVISIRFHIEN